MFSPPGKSYSMVLASEGCGRFDQSKLLYPSLNSITLVSLITLDQVPRMLVAFLSCTDEFDGCGVVSTNGLLKSQREPRMLRRSEAPSASSTRPRKLFCVF